MKGQVVVLGGGEEFIAVFLVGVFEEVFAVLEEEEVELLKELLEEGHSVELLEQELYLRAVEAGGCGLGDALDVLGGSLL